VKVGFLVLLSTFDSKVGLFVHQFFARSTAEGMRLFRDEAMRPDSSVAAHPEDYSLFRLGEVDQTSGRLEPELAPVQVCTALELVASEQLRAVK